MRIERVEFVDYLDTRSLKDDVNQLLNNFVTLVHSDDSTVKITIKRNFITDFASVPRIPFAYLLLGNMGHYPAVTHDGLYSNSSLVEVVDYDTGLPFRVTRAWADDVLYYGLIERGIPAFSARIMYAGVRLKGCKYYKKFS